MKVHLAGNYDLSDVDRLKAQLHQGIDLTCSVEIDSETDFEILVKGVPSADDLKASQNIHTLIIPWAGLPQKTGKLLKDFPKLAVHNLHHNAGPTAEMAVTLMITVMKKIIPIDRSLRKGDWKYRYGKDYPMLIEGKKVLVLGYGTIGKRVGDICRAMGMSVTGVRRNSESKEENIYSINSLHDLLPDADVLFITLPHTNETNELIREKELSLLQDNSVIVNIARGAVINQKALYDELKPGRIHAGIDVWYNYPQDEKSRECTPPSDFRFEQLDNVVMTPHLAGHSEATEILRMNELAKLLNAANDGVEIPNKVDVERGY